MTRVMILGLLLSTVRGYSQFAGPPDSASAQVIVQSDVDSALVILDGEMVGTTPVTLTGLASGGHSLRILHPDLQNWSAPVITDSLEISPGEKLERQYHFERQYVVQSNPSGAEVILGNRVIGMTPLLVRPGARDSLIQIRKPGYMTGTVPFAEADRGHLWVSMTRDPDTVISEGVVSTDAEGSSVLPIVLSGVSSVVAGGFSAYFKVQADQAYGEYALSGDPAKLAQTRKLDNVAGIALAASQIYFALFSYLLITQ